MPHDSEQQISRIEPNPEPGGFLDELRLIYIGGKRPYQLADSYRYDSLLLGGQVITVPAGYDTDFASVPRLFWRILPPHGPYVPAAIIHDWLCDQAGKGGIDSATTHKVFREAMEVLEVPWWKRKVMYYAVRWFGPRFPAHSSLIPHPSSL